jgi:hypothetical protein
VADRADCTISVQATDVATVCVCWKMTLRLTGTVLANTA